MSAVVIRSANAAVAEMCAETLIVKIMHET